jgi:two-component system, NtrC family, sensor kinase
VTSRWQFLRHRATRLILISQLACVLAVLVLIADVWRGDATRFGAPLLFVAFVSAGVTLYGAWALAAERQSSDQLAQHVVEERKVSATLEQAVARRTVELEDAQRVLQRMWTLGQQITLELNPQRVLDRFLEAVSDMVQADGGVVGLIGDDATIRVVAGVGIGGSLVGHQVPVAGSRLGTVIRTGKAWTTSDEQQGGAPPEAVTALEPLDERSRSMAMVPIARRGERIGAVVLGFGEERAFTTLELDRIEAMGDLLSVSLENAELVETLRQAEWRFRTLFRAAPDAVFTVLQSGHIREANDAVREITGWDPLQVVGREVIDLVLEADRTRLSAALESAFAGHAQRLEVTCVFPPQPTRRVIALAMTRLPEADPPSVLIVGRDMTGEREMRVRLMESDRLAAVGELVAGVAHEVNNPLSSISAFAQLLLRDGGLSPTQRDSIEVIKSETLRASQVVKDLLAFARRSEPLREPIDLNAIVGRTLRLRAYQLTSNKITVEDSLAQDLPAVIGDARQLQQVCLNLVTNAIQAMTALGGGTLFVTTRAEGRDVVLEMRDTGPGIPEGARARIFEPFFTTKGEGEGTGLGLSVSYGIISAHGGSIEVADSSAAGTVFRVTLPGAESDVPEQLARESNAPGARSPLAGIRLLFVDDEPALRSSVEAFGELRGFTVIVASDGIEALNLVRVTGLDAVVCDLRMPGMDGAAFHERLRRLRPGLAARTVFITGDVVTTGISRTATRQPVIMKPFTFERLEEALVSVMRGIAFSPAAP